MNRILLGAIAVLVILFGLYFWISESRIGKLQKLTSAYQAKIAVQADTIKSYDDRLFLVQDSVKKYQTTYQGIQGQLVNFQLEVQKQNIPLMGLEDSEKASQAASTHFNAIFDQLNSSTTPIKGTTK